MWREIFKISVRSNINLWSFSDSAVRTKHVHSLFIWHAVKTVQFLCTSVKLFLPEIIFAVKQL